MATASGGERSITMDKVQVWAEDKDVYLTVEDDQLDDTLILTLPRHDHATLAIRALLTIMGRKVD